MRKYFFVPLLLIVIGSSFAQRPPVAVPSTGNSRLSTVAMVDMPGRPGFEGIALANNYVVISHTDANTIDIFDPQKRRIVAQITNVAQPRGIAVDSKNNRVYVATANSVIDVISDQDWEVKDTFNVEGSPDVLALSPDGVRLYVGDKADSTVAAVDTSLRKTIATTQLPGRPEQIVATDNNVFVSVQDQALVVSIDLQMKISAQFKLNASQPTGLVYDPASKRLYVAVRAAVLALNSDNGTEIARVPAPRGVQNLYLDPSSHTIFAAGGGSILALNTANGLTSTDELLADVKGHSIIYDSSRKLLFMPGGREGRSKMLIVKDLKPGPVPQEAASSEAAVH